ncbi:MAG: RNA methyltransferase [Bryobacteraceae bacterium]|nr:RNA methyltransferase [Bryobacteraceae bacterium]MDW8378864.1 RNA methyltransferase [Bryobacterales bacterium]
METRAITSARNTLLKELRRALARGGLTSDGYALAEGFHLLEEALQSRCELGGILAAQSALPKLEQRVEPLQGLRVTVVEDKLFQSVATTETSQGVIALVKPKPWAVEDLFNAESLVVVLDGVQDPGNAGTIVRAAEAFGASGAVFVKGSVHPYHPKTLRASAGSLFRLPILYGIGADEVLRVLRQKGLERFAAMPAAQLRPDEVDFRRKCAIMIGSEAHGVSSCLREGARQLSIPTSGVESLNAAMAAAVLLYEASRQRRRPGGAA